MIRTGQPPLRSLAADDASKSSLFLTLYLIILCCLFVTHLDLYLNDTGKLPISLPQLFIISIGPLAFYLLAGRDAAWRMARSIGALYDNGWPIFFFLIWLAASVILLAVVTIPPEAALSSYVPLFQMLVLLVGIMLGSLPGARSALRWAATLAIFTLGASIFYDVVFPATFSTIDSRPAGFAVNANVAALELIICLVMLIDYHRLRIFDVLMIAIVLTATMLTLSRGGMLLLLVGVATYLAYQMRNSNALQRVLVLTMLGISGIVVLNAAETIIQGAALFEVGPVEQRFDRLLFKDSFYESNDSRIHDFQAFLAMALQRPVLGYGPGFSIVDRGGLDQGPHNMYVRAWVDLGIFGLLSYLGLLGSGLYLFLRRGFAAGVALVLVVSVAGIFSHNIIDDKSFLLLFGLALGLSAAARGRTTPQARVGRGP